MSDYLIAPLRCPKCWRDHIDSGEWASRPHHKHLCEHCGFIWRIEPYVFGGAPIGGSVHDAALKRARADALEEAAKVADEYTDGPDGPGVGDYIAQEIRALAPK